MKVMSVASVVARAHYAAVNALLKRAAMEVIS